MVNMAMSSDGKIATANRRVATFGSSHDREQLYRLRAGTDAILCGARTLMETGARLDTGPRRFRQLRLRHGLAPHPLRVVVSGTASLPTVAPAVRYRRPPLLLLASPTAAPQRIARLRAAGVRVEVFGTDGLDLRSALTWLHTSCGVRRLLCEGGAQLNASLFASGLVDELRLTICPCIVGGRQAPTLADGTTEALISQALDGRLTAIRPVGRECFLTYRFSSARRAISQRRSEKRLRNTTISSLPR